MYPLGRHGEMLSVDDRMNGYEFVWVNITEAEGFLSGKHRLPGLGRHKAFRYNRKVGGRRRTRPTYWALYPEDGSPWHLWSVRDKRKIGEVPQGVSFTIYNENVTFESSTTHRSIDIGVNSDDAGDPPSYFSVDSQLVKLSNEGLRAVVGARHYQQALNMVAKGKIFGWNIADHAPVQALLNPEPENEYDENAVRVDLLLNDRRAVKVGYLSRAAAGQYQRYLLELRSRGKIGTCPGRIRGGGTEWRYTIYLHLAYPAMLFQANSVAGSEILLESERFIEVDGTEDHQEFICSHPGRYQNDDYTEFTLDYCVSRRPKDRGNKAIEVRLEGVRVGELSKYDTDTYNNIVGPILGRECIPSCLGEISHDAEEGWKIGLRMPWDPLYPI